MFLAGIRLSNELVAELVTMLRGEYYFKAADTLDAALADDASHVALTIRERTVILDVLDDPPPGLAHLREVLLAEYVWWAREGLTAGRAR